MTKPHPEAQQVFRQFAWNLAGKLATPRPPTPQKGKRASTRPSVPSAGGKR